MGIILLPSGDSGAVQQGRRKKFGCVEAAAPLVGFGGCCVPRSQLQQEGCARCWGVWECSVQGLLLGFPGFSSGTPQCRTWTVKMPGVFGEAKTSWKCGEIRERRENHRSQGWQSNAAESRDKKSPEAGGRGASAFQLWSCLCCPVRAGSRGATLPSAED